MSNAEQRAREHFDSVCGEHEMTVLHEDGVYRHLRFQKPGTWMYGYDLVTWPGHLAINGDLISGYTFARINDMVEFFNEPDINPRYWAEKITNHAAMWSVKKYDEDAEFNPYTDDERPWEWDHTYLLCCHAIRAGCETYLAAKAVPA